MSVRLLCHGKTIERNVIARDWIAHFFSFLFIHRMKSLLIHHSFIVGDRHAIATSNENPIRQRCAISKWVKSLPFIPLCLCTSIGMWIAPCFLQFILFFRSLFVFFAQSAITHFFGAVSFPSSCAKECLICWTWYRSRAYDKQISSHSSRPEFHTLLNIYINLFQLPLSLTHTHTDDCESFPPLLSLSFIRSFVCTSTNRFYQRLTDVLN